jgi:hypothetical protein
MTALWINFADYITQAGDLLIAHPILSIIATYLLVRWSYKDGYADGLQDGVKAQIEWITEEESE